MLLNNDAADNFIRSAIFAHIRNNISRIGTSAEETLRCLFFADVLERRAGSAQSETTHSAFDACCRSSEQKETTARDCC